MARKKYSEMTPEELNEYMERAETAAELVGGGTAGLATGALGAAWRVSNNDSFVNQMNRSDFLNENWDRFKDVNPQLNSEFVKDGEWGVRSVYDKVWAKTIGEGRGWIPSDISKTGEFLKNKKSLGLSSVLTVTPEPVSQRFSSAVPDGGTGGGQSATLWGNTEVPQYGYARGNLGVGEVQSNNPSAQFSAVDLPPSEKTKYYTTGGANDAGASERGWGQAGNHDTHFGKEYRKAGGVTAANDIYTYLKNEGIEPPMPTGDAAYDLETLSNKLADYHETSPYNALERIASPSPTFGPSSRSTGQLPSMTHADTAGGAKKPEAGFGTYFQEVETPEAKSAISLRDEITPTIRTNSKHGIRWTDQIKEAFDINEGPGNKLARRGLGGVTGTLMTSPESIKAAREGNYGQAAFITGASYGTGELFAGGANMLVEQAVKRGHHWVPKVASGATRLATPLVAIDAMDAVSTAMTGKNVRELAVESGNVGPALQAMSTPRTMAPLGGAGAVSQSVGMQATVPNLHPERKKESEALQQKIEEARERGGRWKIGGFTIPDFGFSEGLDIN